jgi:hypothetical protein
MLAQPQPYRNVVRYRHKLKVMRYVRKDRRTEKTNIVPRYDRVMAIQPSVTVANDRHQAG